MLMFLSEEGVYFPEVLLPFPRESYAMSYVLSAAVICFQMIASGEPVKDTATDVLKHSPKPICGKI